MASLLTTNELILMTGEDIPFPEAGLTIHQPEAREISLIAEEHFWGGCRLLNFNKNLLDERDKVNLADKTDFEIFMSIMCSKEKMPYRNSVNYVLTLLFPTYQIRFVEDSILLANAQGTARINHLNYDTFKDIIISMFLLNDEDGAGAYNPADKRAAQIAEKIKKGKEKVGKQKGEGVTKIALLSKYISTLAIGLQMSPKELSKLTVFQLKDSFTRFQRKEHFDRHIQSLLAGAKKTEDVEYWMTDIH